ncbi:MAG: Fe-S-containing protein [Deferrisomatales bacterium]
MSHNSHDDKAAAKKAAVLGGTPRKNRAVLPLMLFCAALVIGGGVFLLGSQEQSLPPAAQATPAQVTELTHPLNLFADGQSRFFEHQTPEGLTLRYFVLKSSDGTIRSALDACDSCWPAGKGYRQDGDEMVCQNCRMRFPSVKIMEVKGGCNPAPLRHEIRGEQVVIQVQDLLAGGGYFDFGKKGG